MRFLIAGAAVSTLVGAETLKQEWDQWKKQFKKSYTPAEELVALQNFQENQEFAAQMRILSPGTDFGTNSLSDMSIRDFQKRNALDVTKADLEAHRLRAKQQALAEPKRVYEDPLPQEFDWRKTDGAIQPVKNQAMCGSCWAFSTVATTECNEFLTNKRSVSLSEQELVSCDSNDMGCNGGMPSRAFSFLMTSNNGFETESDYDYTSGNGNSGVCKLDKGKEQVYIQNYKSVEADPNDWGKTEDNMARVLMEGGHTIRPTGTLSIAMNASHLSPYKGGIYKPSDAICNPQMLDHAVAIVGFGEENGEKYWTVRNSWGSDWGEQGYFRILRGKNTCGIDEVVTQAMVKKADDGNAFMRTAGEEVVIV